MKLVSHLPKSGFWLYLGPVLNVLLLLLLFFLLGSNFVIQSGITVRLPESASRLTGFDRAHVVTLPSGNDTALYFNGRSVTLGELEKELSTKKGEGRRLIIHADQMAPLGGNFQQVSNLALRLGYEVAYATQPVR